MHSVFCIFILGPRESEAATEADHEEDEHPNQEHPNQEEDAQADSDETHHGCPNQEEDAREEYPQEEDLDQEERRPDL